MPQVKSSEKFETPIFYKTSAKWTHSHQGRVSSPKKPNVPVVCPPPFCHERDDVWSPEEFYVSAIEMCLMMTFLYMAERAEIAFLSYQSRAEGLVEFVEGKAQFTKVNIWPRIEVENEKMQKKVGLMLKGAARNCLISASIKTEVEMYPEILVTNAVETKSA